MNYNMIACLHQMNNGARRYRPMCAIAMPAWFCFAAACAWAQNPAAGEPIGQAAPENRSQVQYLEPAVPFAGEPDFALPPPELPRDPQLDPGFERRDYLAAIEAYDQALQIQRINMGLHNLEQVPLVERMIDSYIAMGEWGQADAYQEYLYYIQQKSHGNDSPQLISALGRLGDWHLKLIAIDKGDPLEARLRSAQDLFIKGANMVDEHHGKDDPRYVEFLRGVARSAYFASINRSELREMNRARYGGPPDEYLSAMDFSPIRSMNNEAREALTGIVRLYENREVAREQLAEATAQLADWYLLTGNRGRASETYRQAWDILAEEEDADELRRQLFGQVRQIPVYGYDNKDWMIESLAYEESEEELHHDFVDIRLDVTAWGRVRNIETVSEAPSDAESRHRWIRQKIRRSWFRPVLIEGETTLSTDNLFRFRYWY